MRRTFAICLMAMLSVAVNAEPAVKWVTGWAASVQGPYPVGNPSAQPDLKMVFPDPKIGARDQSFRLIVRPDVWGAKMRERFSNAFGTRPVTFDGVHVGLQLSGSQVEQDDKRKALNDFIRTSGAFDAIAEFDRAGFDTATGQLRPEFVPESTTGGPGDKLHPNRLGYQAMGMAIDIDKLFATPIDAMASKAEKVRTPK